MSRAEWNLEFLPNQQKKEDSMTFKIIREQSCSLDSSEVEAVIESSSLTTEVYKKAAELAGLGHLKIVNIDTGQVVFYGDKIDLLVLVSRSVTKEEGGG